MAQNRNAREKEEGSDSVKPAHCTFADNSERQIFVRCTVHNRNWGFAILRLSYTRFDPVMNKWDWVGELPEPRHHHSVAFLRGKVYLVGGADPRDDEERTKSAVLSTTWCFDPATRSWSMEPALGVARKSFSLVAHRLALYAIGGQDKKGRVLRSVERFDPKTRSWREVRAMTVARMGPAAAKCREHIWVAGGMTGERHRPVSATVECYNSKTNQYIHSVIVTLNDNHINARIQHELHIH
ncbi:Alpha-scruin [Eumeta japonica]|uniref:Alpha-scruin n=1 Tax=Eumeta variegata TaxID=151549 RepID=A0A4C1VWZ7_EUMVA|nr:Alpha-scruin [Eumeta japonica]